MHLRLALPLALPLALVLAPASFAQWSAVEQARLLPSTTSPLSGYGSAVALDGSTCAVGMPRLSTGLSGRAVVHVRSSGVWTQQAELLAADDAVGNGLGCALALDGDTLVVGARGATTGGFLGAGAAYVFVRNGSTWTQQAKLVPNDPEQSAEFGYAVALDGDTCAIGAPQSTSASTLFAGATYVFVRGGATWTLQQRIVPNAAFNAIYGSRSGRALALRGNTLLIGAPLSFDLINNAISTGRAFEWTRAGSSWSQSAEIVANDTPDQRQFACSIDFDGTRAIFGAWAESHLPSNIHVGSAYVFKRGATWTQEQKLLGAGTDDADAFGSSVALDGTTAIVGAPNGASTGGATSGTVRLFDFDGSSWSERLALSGSATSDADRLGTAVALDADFALAGAELADVPSAGTPGEAYVWGVQPPPTSSFCTAKTNSLGCVPMIGSSGTPSVSSPNAFVVSVVQVLNQKQGLMFYGYAPAAAPFQGGSLCVQPPTQRLPATNSGGNASGSSCTGSYAYDFNAHIDSGLDPALVAGADAYCQFWMRDPASASTTGLSNGLRVHIQP
ncbi:MAG: hypothetical protein IT454_21020 [Planctomycetes bacterium]|nr:hypothetical protein [Planctomycetota bacterium]